MFCKLNLPITRHKSARLLFNFSLLSSLLLLSPLSFAAQAQQKITLKTAIKNTLEKNPSLKVFEFKQQILNGQKQVQSLNPGYELGFDIDNFAGTGELKAIDNAELSVSISSVIEMDDKLNARINTLNQQSNIIKVEQKIKALDLISEVTQRYIHVLAAQARIELANEATVLAQNILDEVEKLSKAGITPTAEVKRAMAALGNAKLTASSELQKFEIAKLNLSIMWNQTTPNFAQVTGQLYQFSKDIALEQLLTKIKNNPSITFFASDKRLKESQLRLAQTQSNADINWSVGIKRIQGINDTAFTAGFSMPLFSMDRNQGNITSATAAINQVEIEKENRLMQLHGQLFQAYSNRKQAIYQVNNLKNTIIPVLESALTETKILYQNGRYRYLDYLSAKQELLSAQSTLINSASSALLYGSQIEQLIAEPLPVSQHLAINHF